MSGGGSIQVGWWVAVGCKAVASCHYCARTSSSEVLHPLSWAQLISLCLLCHHAVLCVLCRYPVYPPMRLQVWVGSNPYSLQPASPWHDVLPSDALQTFALWPHAPVGRYGPNSSSHVLSLSSLCKRNKSSKVPKQQH